MRTILCTVARVPTVCMSSGVGVSSRASFWAVTTMERSSPSDSISWMELSRPTVRGRTAWGNKTVSRTGRTGTRRRFGLGSEGPRICGGAGGCWFSIECPFINFTYIRLRRMSKVAGIPEPARPDPSLLSSRNYGIRRPGSRLLGFPAGPSAGPPERNRLPPIPLRRGDAFRTMADWRLAFPANVIGHALGKVSVADDRSERVVRLDAAGEHRVDSFHEKGSEEARTGEAAIWRWVCLPPPGWRTGSVPTRDLRGPQPETVRVLPPR